MFKGKVILVTGGTGSIGSALVRRLLKENPKVIRIYSRDEGKHFELQNELPKDANIRFLIGDVRDRERLRFAMQGVDIVFHCAAMKHVPYCEYNPFEAIKTNVQGTQNLIDISLEENVEVFVNVSTDKAAQPFSTMGASKLLAERLVSAANYYKGKRRTIFTSVRFGNVIGTRGSIFDLLIRKIKNREPLPITHPKMTRFFMSIEKAVELILKSTQIAQGGEVFVLKMKSVTLGELFETFIEVFAPLFGYKKEEIKIVEIGPRPGEKFHETLISPEESEWTLEIDDLFIIQTPVEVGNFELKRKKYEGVNGKTKFKFYTSENAERMPKEELKKYLEDLAKDLLEFLNQTSFSTSISPSGFNSFIFKPSKI